MREASLPDRSPIRPIRVDDAPAIVPLLDGLGYPTHAGTLRIRLADITARSDYAGWAWEDDGVAGFVGAWVGRSFVHDEPIGRIIVLVVDDRRRGQGIGTALMGVAERWLVEQGVRMVTITSATRRTEAHRFYERIGYDVTGVRLVKKIGASHEKPTR